LEHFYHDAKGLEPTFTTRNVKSTGEASRFLVGRFTTFAAASPRASRGVASRVVEKILNYQSGSFAGIVGAYQRHSFAEEMCAALTRWAEHVERAVTGGGEVKVIKLKGSRI
jgi:hypothetical protein